jgi:hypothetical protein
VGENFAGVGEKQVPPLRRRFAPASVGMTRLLKELK